MNPTDGLSGAIVLLEKTAKASLCTSVDSANEFGKLAEEPRRLIPHTYSESPTAPMEFSAKIVP